ncbi:SRPBCC family protein [Kineosporia sp. R_H_3]|uniref:SRPBCC family protein n=1 Tax=Kineosporia sp. R_H_3 TaxID=1961848 RepID=UPI000B4B79D9|nr:SRPBCC family protein [Kineosporia sp. R_H_3]
MTATVVSTDINRSAAEVYAYATDPTRFSQWQAGVVDGHLEHTAAAGVPPAAPTIGTRCMTTRRIGGANRSSTSLITHVDPPRTWGVRGTDGPIRAIVDLTVEPLDGNRSRLTISVDFTGHGIGRLLVPLVVRRQARTEMPNNLADLKRTIEASARIRSGNE